MEKSISSLTISSMAAHMTTMVCTSPTSYSPPRQIPNFLKPPPGNRRTAGTILQLSGRKPSRRGISVVTRAGPSSTSYIFAFVFPLSLLAVTIFTSARIADKLDQKFFEELAVNEAILEGEEDGGDEVPLVSMEKEEVPAPIRARNRPKREAESSTT